VAAVRFLVVRLAGREYAIPASRICGMVQMRGLEMQPIEGFGEVRYLANLHGRTLPVYVPNRILGLEEQPVSSRSCLLLIRGERAEGVREALDADAADSALVVDSVSRLAEVPAAFHRTSGGQVRLGEKWRDVLDVDLLCRARHQAVRRRMT